MEEKIAKIISVIFHPLLIPSYAMLIMINAKNHYMLVLPIESRYIALLIVALSSFILPSIFIFILLKTGIIKSLQMENRHERVLPLFLAAIFFYGTYYLLKQEPHFALFNFFMLGATLLVIISLLINYLVKISIHMVAQGGLFGALTGYAITFGQNNMLLIFLIVFVAGIIGFARLKLNAHTEAEVYSGFGLGVLVMLGLFLFV
jgi:hypothetical protein